MTTVSSSSGHICGKSAWVPGKLAISSFAALFVDEDLIVVSLLPLLDSTTLIQARMTDKTDGGIITKYRTQLPYALLLAKRAKQFMIGRVISQHATCIGWTPDSLAAKATERVEKFATILVGSSCSLESSRAMSLAMKAVSGSDDLAIEGWTWEAAIRFLLPVAASYGDTWDEAAFAIEVCARALCSRELLALFAPDSCAALEALAIETNNELGISVAAVLGSMIRTCTAATEPLMVPVAEALILKSLSRAKTCDEFTFMIVCMSMLGKMKLIGQPTAGTRKIMLPGRLYSSICLQSQGPRQQRNADINAHMKFLGIDRAARVRPHLEQTLECAEHVRPPRRVANMMQQMFAGPILPIAGSRLDGGPGAALFATLLASGVLSVSPAAVELAAPSAQTDDAADESEFDPLATNVETANGVAPAAASGSEAVDVDEAGGNNEDNDDEEPVTIAPEDIAAMVNEIAAQTGVSPAALFEHFLRQDASAIEDDPNVADDGDNVLELERGSHEQTVGDVSGVLTQSVGQMQAAAAASLDTDDEDDGRRKTDNSW
jgi:hypothetical protein